jgi:hypothetical protein
MLDLRLEYIGNGQFRAATGLDYRLCLDKFQQGDKLKAKVTQPRSVRQNALFHALIQAAYENQRGGPRLDSWEKLKAYLLIEAGHTEERRFSIGSISPALAALVCGGFAQVIRQRHEYMAAGIDTQRNEVVMRFAKSVSFAKCDSPTMGAITDKVVAHICTDIVPGMDPASIMNMAREREGAA